MKVWVICAAVVLAGNFAAPAGAQIALGPGAIVARVRDSAGKPLPGALLTATGPTSRRATTSAAGLVTLAALPAGRYDLAVSLAGYAPWTGRVIVPNANAPQVVTPQLEVASFSNLA
ncbi:MAG: carboxypeptidase regulatory-like domain-containing protein, partial [Candidatus Eremiobacteraeota bacterium]|nr:carboxypeptidase regulatory-like domain-containing protein [Candidatus Eremiobacteraeota bacterium]